MSANCLSNGDNIRVGQQIVVPRLPVTAIPIQAAIAQITDFHVDSATNQLMWATSNAAAVDIQLSQPLGAIIDYGQQPANGAFAIPALSADFAPQVTFWLTLRDAQGNDILDAAGQPISRTLMLPWPPIGSSPTQVAIAQITDFHLDSATNQLMWATSNAAAVDIRLSQPRGANIDYGQQAANGAFAIPALSADFAPQVTFWLTLRDAQGNDILDASGQPINRTLTIPYAASGTSTLACPAADATGQGQILVSPFGDVEGDCLVIAGNQTVSLSWFQMPETVQSVTYYLIPMQGNCGGEIIGNPVSVASDSDTSNGNDSAWFTGVAPCAGVLFASGTAGNISFPSPQRPIIIR